MSNWSDGYVSEIPYTFGYYPELNPYRASFSLILAGFAPPKVECACELGFGQGLSINIHAASSATDWWGTDFNPSHVSTATSLLKSSVSNLKVFDSSFEEFQSRDDLPPFDFIGLHGVWSWISEENRNHIVSFIRKNLRVGGVVYTSYNTFPGWTSFYPIRHLLTEHRKSFGSSGRGILAGIEGALDFAKTFIDANSAYLSANPDVGKRLSRVTAQNRRYLAHEYFNEDWHPMFFSEVADYLSRCKLDFVCPAGSSALVDLGLTNDQRKILDSITDRTFRQTVRDFMVNEQFRKDYWIRGPRAINADERRALLGEIKVLLLHDPRPSVSDTDGGIRGGLRMNPELLYPLLELLLSRKVYRIAEIHEALSPKGVTLQALAGTLSILLNQGFLEIAKNVEDEVQVKTHTDMLNQHILDQAKGSGDLCFLASPVTGGGVFLNRFKQLYLNAIRAGAKGNIKRSWATNTYTSLRSLGQFVVKDGKTLEDESDATAELLSIAEDFDTNDRQKLISLGIL